jgi:hypothetical protein
MDDWWHCRRVVYDRRLARDQGPDVFDELLLLFPDGAPPLQSDPPYPSQDVKSDLYGDDAAPCSYLDLDFLFLHLLFQQIWGSCADDP